MKRIKTFLLLRDYEKKDVMGYLLDMDTSLFIHKTGYNEYGVSDLATGTRVYTYTTSSYKKAVHLFEIHYKRMLGDILRDFKQKPQYKRLVERLNRGY
jgi:hypothetical protein